jgi:hypothetical protein
MSSVKLSAKQIGGIVVAVLTAAIIAHYDDFLPYRWQSYSAPDGSFSAQFPGKPEVADQQVELATGGTVVTHQIAAAPAKTTSYNITYFEDPRLANESAEEVLNSAREGSIAKVQGNLVSEQRLEVEGHPARDLEIHARGNSTLSVRMIAVRGRLFMLMVVDTGRERADSKNDRKFFDSFKLSG